MDMGGGGVHLGGPHGVGYCNKLCSWRHLAVAVHIYAEIILFVKRQVDGISDAKRNAEGPLGDRYAALRLAP